MSKLPAEGLPLSASACNNSCVFQLMKEFPLLSMFNIHENLLESLLELQNYADVQAVLAKYDGEKHSFEASTALPSPLTCALCLQISVYPNLQQYATQQRCSKPGRYQTSEYRFQSTATLTRGGGGGL